MADKKITNTDTLTKAIAALELKKKLLEAKIDSNGEHLQKNFMSMAMRSVVPKTSFETGPFAAAGNFLKNEKFKDGFTKLVSSVTGMATEGMESIMNKIKGRKDEKAG